MKKNVIIILLAALSMSAHAQQKDEAAIRTMLQAQVAQWNTGSVSGYMKGYWESDSLQFIGKNGPVFGYAAALHNYEKAYPDAAHMGQLTSTIISMKRLSPEYYFITGKWALKRAAGDVGGAYTLLIRKIHGQWVVISDHSS